MSAAPKTKPLNRSTRLPLILVIIVPVLALWPVVAAEFIPLDDTANVSRNPDFNPPTLAKIDQALGAIETSKPPASCARPARVMSAGGVSLLLCEGPSDRTLVLAADESGAWRAEGELAAPPHARLEPHFEGSARRRGPSSAPAIAG